MVRRLAEHFVELSPLCAEIIEAFDTGDSVGDLDLLNRLWIEIESLPLSRQGGRRTMVTLLQPDRDIDGYEAGFLLLWAEEEGLSPEAFVSALAPN